MVAVVDLKGGLERVKGLDCFEEWEEALMPQGDWRL